MFSPSHVYVDLRYQVGESFHLLLFILHPSGTAGEISALRGGFKKKSIAFLINAAVESQQKHRSWTKTKTWGKSDICGQIQNMREINAYRT